MKISRRDFLEVGGATALLSATGSLLPGWYANAAEALAACARLPLPARAERPRFRWWWSGGYIEPDEIEREVNAIADAGFGGFEIADVRDSLTVPLDPKIYGWGSARWLAGVERAFEVAARRGLKADITIGAHWPTGMPGVTPNDPAAAQEVVYGASVVEAGQRFDAALPVYPVEPAGLRQLPVAVQIVPRLLAVQAWREQGSEGKTVTLDPASRIELTGKAVDGRLDWTAPAQGRWHVLAFWVRGTAQIQNMFGRGSRTSMLADPIPFVVDIFGKAGAQACIDYWEGHLLPPRIRSLARRIGGNFFEDSLELSAVQHWSPDLPAEFRRRRGYELGDFLPLLAVTAPTAGAAAAPAFGGPPPAAPYALAGVDSARFDHDFARTLGEMYVDFRIKPLQNWANTLGMGFRVQCIGSGVDSASASAFATVPEGDNSCDMDAFRVLAAGRDIAGHKVLSDEAATFVGGQSGVAMWKLMLFMVQRDFMGGVNQLVLHGFSYADSPDATWPGFSAFGRMIGEDWGPRSPQWTLAPDIAAYLSRLQSVLQSGRGLSDVAILHTNDGINARFADPGLRQAGYTYQFPGVALLSHPRMKVVNGRLAAEGPGYRALIVNQPQTLEVAAVQAVAAYARQGLPIVVVGVLPQYTGGLYRVAESDALLARALAELLSLKGVVHVADEAAVPAALRAAGVLPSLGFSRPSRVMGLRRHEARQDCYYLLNDADAPMSLTVSVTGKGVPYRVNLWSGAIEPVALYSEADGRFDIPMSFAANEAVVILVSPAVQGCERPAVHALQGTGEWCYAAGKLAVRSNQAASFTAQLSDGRNVNVTVPDPGAAIEPRGWSLQVEDWQPGAKATETRKVSHAFQLDVLLPWSQIPEIQDASGVGTYSTSFTLPDDWSAMHGARLELGHVGGTCRVSINGTQLPPVDQFSAIVEIGPYVRRGVNRLEVIVATTLNNRLRAIAAATPAAAGGGFGPGGGGGFAMAGAKFSADWQPPAGADPLQPPKGEYLGAPVQAPAGAGGGPQMLPGAGDPGGPRAQQAYGLIGPVRVVPYLNVVAS